MSVNNEVEQGWEFAAGIMGAGVAAQIGKDYVSAVEAAIHELENNINKYHTSNQDISHLQGFLFEEWSAGTFNINATAAGSIDKARLPHSNGKFSIDIMLDSGKTYSAKSYKTAEESAVAQAQLDKYTRQAGYKGQGRLVTSDQLEGARAAAERRAIRNQEIRPDVAEANAETSAKLTDRIINDEGISSKEVTRKELNEIARESKNEEFSAEKHGVTADEAIKTEYMLKNALKAGYSAAVVTAVMQLAPEIYKAVDYLIKNGEIDIQQLKTAGVKAISGGAEGFLRGFISSSLITMCAKGAFGEAFIGINPSVLGTLVSLTLQTVKNSILVAAGKMDARQMGASFIDTVVISSGYLLGAQIGGIIGQAIGFELPVIGYLLGSLIGTSFCVVYNIGKKQLISFCVDTGFTCFGLVEQNYELPAEVLEELGVETIPIPRTQIDVVELSKTAIPVANISTTEYETIDLAVLRRGVIGVNKVGYVYQ